MIALICIMSVLLMQVDGVCRDLSEWCPNMNKYGACSYHAETRRLCPRNCGLCTVKCKEVPVHKRQDCGHAGISQKKCESRGCCYIKLTDNKNGKPWCFFPQDHCSYLEGHKRRECGFYGIGRDECLNKGCCWSPIKTNPKNHPWCHHSEDASTNQLAGSGGGENDPLYVE